MRLQEVLDTLKAHRSDLDRLGVADLALFGSVVREEAGSDSDLDVLVDFHVPATFDGYMDLKFFLEDLFGREVDLVTRKALREKMRASIEHEAVHVS
jgi:predicted nucleotidyltransferase